jgi:hypothetical protein
MNWALHFTIEAVPALICMVPTSRGSLLASKVTTTR